MTARRLPKLVDSDPRAPQLASLVSAAQPAANLTRALSDALRSANRARRVVRGIDAATKTLADEKRGQALVDQRTGEQRGARISRVLFVASDGSTGFYRQVDKLSDHHEGRLLVIRLDAGAAELGAILYGPGREARALLITHKEAVAATLLALVPLTT